MRCREARQKIEESQGSIRDRELLEHLRSCPECAGLARAESMLDGDLRLASKDDTAAGISFSAMRARVESRVELASSDKDKETRIMTRMVRSLNRRPRLGISIAVVVILLAAAALIPFKLSQTIGYEVAIAGVNKDLALDQNRVMELLNALGVENAEYKVDGCEQTCHLTITDLKDQYEVQLITAAFNEMGNCIIEKVVEVSDKESGSLINHARNKIFFTNFELKESDEIHEIVAEKILMLKGDSLAEYSVWVSGESDGDSMVVDLILSGDSMAQYDIRRIDNFHDAQFATGMMEIRIEDENGMRILYYTGEDGTEHQLDMNAPDFEEQLERLGINLEISPLGEDQTFVITKTMDDSAGDTAADKDEPANLPEGYNLSQNYPNPFNPTTKIDYSIPTAQHVRIDIFNINGQKVRTLVDSYISAGPHTVEWDSRDDHGSTVASGIYLYKLQAGSYSETRKMNFIK